MLVPSVPARSTTPPVQGWHYDPVAAKSVTTMLFLAAGVIGLSTAFLPGWPGGNRTVIAALSVGALISGLTLRSVRQVPYRVCLVLTIAGNITISAAQYWGGKGGTVAYAALYGVALAAAFLFYSSRVVMAQVGLAAAAQASVLYLSGAGRTAPATVVLTLGSACATGLVVRSLAAHRARAEQELAWQASHDGLTGLPNRLELARRWQLALATGEDVSALVLDLRGFKQINDTWGHHRGDALLVETGRRLAGLCAPAVPARLGGDEFAVLLPGVGSSAAAEWTAQVTALLNGTCRVDELELSLRSTVGSATYQASSFLDTKAIRSDPEGNERLSALLAAADAAMYRARQAEASTSDTREAVTSRSG